MHRQLSIRLLLIFALLFSQLGGLSHGIAHTLEGQKQDQSLAPDRLCDLCASYAQLGTAFISPASLCVPDVQRPESAAPATFALFFASFSAFAARAPPYTA